MLSPFRSRIEKKAAGYPLERFLLAPRSDFLCVLCGMVVREPLECGSCGRLFCLLCLFCKERNLGENFDLHCPNCGPKILPRAPSKILIRILNEQKMYCKYKDNGCLEKVSFGKVATHEAGCLFQEITCKNHRFCNKAGLAKDFIQVNYSEISKEGYVCSKMCKKLLKFEKNLAHNKKNAAIRQYFKGLQKLNTFQNN